MGDRGEWNVVNVSYVQLQARSPTKTLDLPHKLGMTPSRASNLETAGTEDTDLDSSASLPCYSTPIEPAKDTTFILLWMLYGSS